MNTPSLIARNFVMLGINFRPDETSLNSTVLQENVGNNDQNAKWDEWQEFISMLCDRLDFLLLFSSSHKFLIFVLKCNMIKIPLKKCCIVKCNLWIRE